MTEEPDAVRPVLRVVRGTPTPEELAAITAIVTAASSGGGSREPENSRGRWADPFDAHERPWPFGPNGWRSAFRTR